jgi:hypothetical protein
MNRAFCTVLLFFSILLIFFASVYLINTKAQQIITSSSPSPPKHLSNQLGFTQIYTPKPGGRVFTAMYITGGNCTPDGIRFNIANEQR